MSAPGPAQQAKRSKRLILGAWADGVAPATDQRQQQARRGTPAAPSAAPLRRGAAGQSSAAAVAEHANSWTSRAAFNAVNLTADYKGPLKGKGGGLAHWRDEANARLQRLYSEMEQLSVQSRSLPERSFGLMVYGLREGRQLRWRMTSGQHAIWERVEPLLAAQPAGLARWYRAAQDQAVILNHREQVLRYEVRTVERLLERGRPREARAYRGQVGRGVGGGRPAAA